MSYDFPRYPRTYTFLYAAADINRGFVGPKGVKGRLIDYGWQAVSTTFGGDTTKPQISVGVAADHDLYGDELDGGTIAATDGGKSVLSTYSKLSDIATYILNDGAIEANVAPFVYVTHGTGGSAGGAATAFMTIYWGA